MTERLRATFAACRAQGRPALVTYVMGGDPDIPTSLDLALACARGGADILEIGMPFSDPIADGPVIQRAAERSLKAGTTVAGCLELAAELRRQLPDTPLALMGYLNPVLSMGTGAFVLRCAEAGVDAIILPDLPVEEAAQLREQAAACGVGLVFLIAPTSTPARATAALDASTAFAYFVSVTGVTGARAALPEETATRLDALRRPEGPPVVVGFGVSTSDQVRALGTHADGVVVGSAIVFRIAQPDSSAQKVARVESFVRSLCSPPQP
ncbi:MAG TPA: tryptophan synthase subunit alpha [Myxococcales bacterium]|nr:tryptophan synthase subunit alpha [Myxococcales bacterium]